MEEREDLNIQGNQGESLPKSQDGNNVSPSYGLNINNIDSIGGQTPTSNVPSPNIKPANPSPNMNPPQNQNPSEASNVYHAAHPVDRPVPLPHNPVSVAPQAPINDQTAGGTVNSNDLYTCTVTDNIIPHRGVIWYILFTLVFMASSALIIFYTDWVLLFVVIVAAGVLLWRGHQGKEMSLEISGKSITLGGKSFLFDDINHFYLSKIGDNQTVNMVLMKKYLPKITCIFFNNEDVPQVKQRLEKEIPTMGEIDESYIDLLIRKLKL